MNASTTTVSGVPHPEAVRHCRQKMAPDMRVMRVFSRAKPLQTEEGGLLGPVDVAYQTLGRLNARGDNGLLICHALTGDSGAWSDSEGQKGWWQDLIGPGKPLDPNRYFLICSNVLGSCYGSTGPASDAPNGDGPWGLRFPKITVRDMVRVQIELVLNLGVRRLKTVIGGSLGGFQVLEWGAMVPHMVDSLVPIATTAQHRPWATAFNELGRQAIMNDPQWNQGAYREQPGKGLGLARMGAMISYRHHRCYEHKFHQINELHVPGQVPGQEPGVASYLRYQGGKFCRRFDANTYLRLTQAMDAHDLGRGRGGLKRVLSCLPMPVLWLAFDTDNLYPCQEQRRDATTIPKARFLELPSPEGHDAFLIEFQLMAPPLTDFLKTIETPTYAAAG